MSQPRTSVLDPSPEVRRAVRGVISSFGEPIEEFTAVFVRSFPHLSDLSPDIARLMATSVRSRAVSHDASVLTDLDDIGIQESILSFLGASETDGDVPAHRPASLQEAVISASVAAPALASAVREGLLPADFGYVPAAFSTGPRHVSVYVEISGMPDGVSRHGHLQSVAASALSDRVRDVCADIDVEIDDVLIQSEDQALRHAQSAATT